MVATVAMVLVKVAGRLVVEALGLTPPGFRGGRGGGTTDVGVKDNPVIFSQAKRTVIERHNMVRVTFAGRECHDKINVPVMMMILRPVMM